MHIHAVSSRGSTSRAKVELAQVLWSCCSVSLHIYCFSSGLMTPGSFPGA